MKKIFTFFVLSIFLISSSIGQDLKATLTLSDGSTLQILVGSPSTDASGTEFGGDLVAGEAVTLDLIPVVTDFSGADPADDDETMACGPVTNTTDVMGNCAMINRGSCFFSDKVHYAQEAGAAMAIICNNNPGEGIINMAPGGTFLGDAVIPSAFVSYEDCATIYAEIDNGNVVSITLSKPGMYDLNGPYANFTPQSQSIPLADMFVRIANPSSFEATGVNATAVVTDPMGVQETITSNTIDIAAGKLDTFVVFDPYTPIDTGMYTIEFSNNFNDVVETRNFWITEYTYGLDSGEPSGFIGPSEDDFATEGLRYDMGSAFLAGSDGGVVTHASFALGNPDSIYTGDALSDAFTAILYEMAPDGATEILGSTDSYDGFTFLGFGSYVLTGDEEQNEELIIELDEPVTLSPNGQYLMVIQYDGTNAGTGIPPLYTTAGAFDYPYFGSVVYTDRLYMGGWTGGSNAWIRMHMDGFLTNVKDLEPLAKSKLSLSPNPASDFVNLSFDLENVADEVQVAISNANGQILEQHTLSGVQNDSYEFKVSHLPNGVYYMSVITPEGGRTKHFVKL